MPHIKYSCAWFWIASPPWNSTVGLDRRRDSAALVGMPWLPTSAGTCLFLDRSWTGSRICFHHALPSTARPDGLVDAASFWLCLKVMPRSLDPIFAFVEAGMIFRTIHALRSARVVALVSGTHLDRPARSSKNSMHATIPHLHPPVCHNAASAAMSRLQPWSNPPVKKALGLSND
ncbi:hypothetical protein BKA81DRAFT_21712 [Phyllosticta paracitricarpa]